ncbi:MAG TPA: capsule biosynthesis protein [Sphingomicrobium sp.]|nr:capsule biosynthesis protein [Sphingomicrobium sp.]
MTQRVRKTVLWVRNARNRRLTYGILALISAVLILFPRPYLARAKIVPQDTSATAASTTSLLGALGSSNQGIGSLLTGGRPPSDLYLIIGRSDSVAQDVIKTLNWVGPGRRFDSYRDAKLFLDRNVDVHLLLGGVMEVETKLYDPDDAEKITAAYSAALSRQLATFGRQIIQNKQKIVQDRFRGAAARVSRAEVALDSFRREHNLAEPEQQLSGALVQRATLEAQLQAKQVELQTMSQFRGPESNELQSLRSDIAGLRAQIARTANPATSPAGPNVAGLTALSLRYLELFRDLKFQQSIYDIYQRSAEQVEVEELASESASYIQVIDPAYIDPHRQVNVWAIALFAMLMLLALFTEWYAPTTGLFTLDADREKRRVLEYAE